MKSLALQKNKLIRFRRWSRMGYAVFCSMGCCVTIGCLSVSISDKSLQKETGATAFVLFVDESGCRRSELDFESVGNELTFSQLQEEVLSEQTVEGAAAGIFDSIFISSDGWNG